MDIRISQLDHKTDEATKIMLQKVIDKKRKYEKLKKSHLFVLWTTILSSFSFFIYLFYTVVDPNAHSFAMMFSVFVSNTMHLYVLMILIGCYGMMNLLREKRDKAESEFHTLRCEIIDKSTDLWSGKDAWQQRHLVFDMMKKQFDINLYYESK